MKQLKYQLKNIRRDKLCILTFLLPIFVGIVIRFLPSMNFNSLGETLFGSIQGDLSEETILWLEDIGNLTEFDSMEELKEAVNNPATQMIGVLNSQGGIRTMLSGDELELNETAGRTLPWLYENRNREREIKKTVVPVSESSQGFQSLFIVLTVVTAMFMGCTFNSMNVIGEKEDGVAYINQILPMSTKTYLVQKFLLGFMGSMASALITAFICIKLQPKQMVFLFLLILLSAYITSFLGLFIGHFSSGLMTGIVCIKIVMILFLAPPILFYILIPPDGAMYFLSYIFPSSAAFYGLMELINGQGENLWRNLLILSIHGVLFHFLFFCAIRRKK